MNHQRSSSLKASIIFLTVFYFQVTSCEINETSHNTLQPVKPAPMASLFSETDTIIVENDTVLFTSTIAVNSKEKLHSAKIIIDSITQHNDSGYVFKLQNGKQITLANVDDDNDAEAFKQYGEYHDLKLINQWLLHVSHYEWSTYELVDKYDGSITEIISTPVISPGLDKIIVTQTDPDGELEFNGIELLRIVNKKIESVFLRELSTISLDAPVWIDNNTVVFKRINFKSHKEDYVKASFK